MSMGMGMGFGVCVCVCGLARLVAVLFFLAWAWSRFLGDEGRAGVFLFCYAFGVEEYGLYGMDVV